MINKGYTSSKRTSEWFASIEPEHKIDAGKECECCDFMKKNRLLLSLSLFRFFACCNVCDGDSWDSSIGPLFHWRTTMMAKLSINMVMLLDVNNHFELLWTSASSHLQIEWCLAQVVEVIKLPPSPSKMRSKLRKSIAKRAKLRVIPLVWKWNGWIMIHRLRERNDAHRGFCQGNRTTVLNIFTLLDAIEIR